jgi:hypothetical protein
MTTSFGLSGHRQAISQRKKSGTYSVNRQFVWDPICIIFLSKCKIINSLKMCYLFSIMYRGSVLDAVSTFKIVTFINSCKIINRLKMCYLHYMSKFYCEGCEYKPAVGVRRCGPVFDEQNAKSFSSVIDIFSS